MNDQIIPAKLTRIETKVLNSRFITTAAPASSVEDARMIIKNIKEEFPDATHNVSAFIIGHGNSTISHCNDDGEPSGTAGRPILAVMEGSGIGDIVVVVTRYFGGTKLGTGGLVKAYGNAAKAVLAEIPLAKRVPVSIAKLNVPYSWYERVHNLIEKYGGRTIDQDFSVEVLITFKMEIGIFKEFQDALNQLSHAQLSVETVETTIDILPV